MYLFINIPMKSKKFYLIGLSTKNILSVLYTIYIYIYLYTRSTFISTLTLPKAINFYLYTSTRELVSQFYSYLHKVFVLLQIFEIKENI